MKTSDLETLTEIMYMNRRIAVGISSLDLDDPCFLRKTVSVHLYEALKALKFKQGELYLLFDNTMNIPKRGRVESDWRIIKPVASIGYEKDEIDDEKYIITRKTLKHGPIKASIEGKKIQIYRNREHIKSLEEIGLVRKNFWEEVIENNHSDVRNNPVSIFRTLEDGRIEIPGFANFAIPAYELAEDEPVPEHDLILAQNAIDTISHSLYLCVAVDERNRAYKDLQEAQATIVNTQRLRIVGEFAGGIAHDIGNLVHNQLQRVSYIVEASKIGELSRGELLKELSEIAAVSKSVQGLSERVNRYAAGGIRQTEYASLNDCVEDVTSLFSRRLEDKGILLSKDLDPKLPKTEMAIGDINQVYTNLLLNSIDATQRKKETSVEQKYVPKIAIRTYSEENNVHSSVYDNGIGIMPENLEKIFEPKFSTKTQVGLGSSGLGLGICKRVLLEHNGEISVRSTPGVETEFNFRIPISTG